MDLYEPRFEARPLKIPLNAINAKISRGCASRIDAVFAIAVVSSSITG